MPYYRYQKARPKTLPATQPRRFSMRLLSPILITLGSLLIANVLWPIINYQLIIAPKLQRSEFISPIPENLLGSLIPQSSTLPLNSLPVRGSEANFQNPQSWFPSAKFGLPGSGSTQYSLSIPVLDIEAAKVIINGTDLAEGLIHYPGTAMPGELGSPVIFGHSVLRHFYRPSVTNPDRYLSIFSKIMTLKNGDQIFIDFDGIRYTYEVKDIFEVKPEDVYILEQKYTNRELKLITCVPEGTYLRRGVVIAQLVDLH